MKSKTLTLITAMTLFATLAIPARLSAQDHSRYKLIDLGTLGGPTSYFSNGNDGILNNKGTAAGWADTSTPDPYTPFCFNPDCFVSHAFQSQNGALTDLGALPGGASSNAIWITANGLIVGTSENGQVDPLFPGFPENRAVTWQNGAITDLGTLPEGGYESIGLSANNGGKVVGFALNTVPDSFSLAGLGFFPTQTRAFLWQKGTMRDLGTLGGNDAAAFFVNDRGQITGQSYTNASPNSTTGLPTADSFFWEKGHMLDIGSLGGTLGNPTAFNNRGQVVGTSNMTGDLTSHPFLWSKKTGLQDLGTLGGNNGVTNWINDAGDIVGKADLPGPTPQNHDAVLWKKKGTTMIDLGVLPGDSCANAYYVNSHGQVVGTSENRDLCLIPTGEHAFLWEDGGPMVDLNTLIPTGSSLQLTFAVAINDAGQIAGFGVPAGCAPKDVDLCGHAYLLIPCDEDRSSVDGCAESRVDASTVPSAQPVPREATGQARPLRCGGTTIGLISLHLAHGNNRRKHKRRCAMRSTPSIRISTIMLFAAPAIPIHPVAQEQQDNNQKHHHYKLIDMGTFGGPASNGIPSLNNRGIAIRGSATSVPAPPPATPLVPEASMGWPHSSSMASNGSHPWA